MAGTARGEDAGGQDILGRMLGYRVSLPLSSRK